ncbi:MAG: 30S ribosomal protein S21, partial [Rivularia sp. (in: cyanobacteria)]
IMPDIKKHRHFETPLQKHKRKAIARSKQRKRRFKY